MFARVDRHTGRRITLEDRRLFSRIAALVAAKHRYPWRSAAVFVDGCLHGLMLEEARCRRALGELLSGFRQSRGHTRLGFARLGDYSRERLGISGSEAETLSRVVLRLRSLPVLFSAFLSGRLSWTKARILVSVASPGTEDRWLSVAREATVRELEDVVRKRAEEAKREAEARKAREGGEGEAGKSHAGEVGSGETGAEDAALADDGDKAAAAVRELSAIHDDDGETLEGEPRVRLRVACPPSVWLLFRRLVELARRAAGEELPVWKAVEAISAEGSSGAPHDPSSEEIRLEAMPKGFLRKKAARFLSGLSAMGVVSDEPLPAEPPPDVVERLGISAAELHDLMPESSGERSDLGTEGEQHDEAPEDERSDDASLLPAEYDRRMRRLVFQMQAIDWKVGRLLSLVVSRRIERDLGFACLEDYVRERLGISLRKARALIALERFSRRCPVLRSAYTAGELSWVRALVLLPVLRGDGGKEKEDDTPAGAADFLSPASEATDDSAGAIAASTSDVAGAAASSAAPTTPTSGSGSAYASSANAWLERARQVTVRALSDQVGWALEQRAAGFVTSLVPPPLGAPLEPVELAVQMRVERAEEENARANGKSPSCPSVFIDFSAPASVAAMFRAAVTVFTEPGEPFWKGLRRLLLHVGVEWSRSAKHPDPVFARDGWRCQVPGCSSRRNLHDHHRQFRSHGGTNALDNRTVTCAAHHLNGIHAGRIRVTGTAPDGLFWELGVCSRPGGAPLLRLRNEVYLDAPPW